MADSSSDCLPKSKIKREFDKESHRDRKQNSHHSKYYDENDRRHSSAVSGRKESHRESKLDSHDRSDRNADDSKSHYSRTSEDRRVSYKSDEMYRRTSSQSRRYDDEPKMNSFRNPDRFHNDKFIGSENRGTLSNNRSNHRQENDERLVKYNNRNNVSSSEDEFVASLFQKIDYLNNQVDFLTQENEKLRYNRNKNRDDLPQEDNAEVNIAFRDKHLEEKFLPFLQELVSQLIAGKRSINELQEFCSRPNLSEEQQLRNELPEADLFAVDNSTTEHFEENAYVPKYNTSFSEILQNEEPEDEDRDKSKKPKYSRNCFNCDGQHMINECPDKIDYRKVAEARRKHQSKRPAYSASVRYHVRGIQDTDFKPGVISDELREAMDLGPHQIPHYIYRMRLFGYPPGWLEEAVVESSGISLYGLDGHDVKEENSENGMQNNGVQVQYDPRKFIDYPGFNIPLPPEVYDECLELRLPHMQPHHMRSYVEEHMPSKSDVCPKRKRKFTVSDSKPSKIQRLEVDMDVENDSDVGCIEFIPPLPEETPPPPPPETITIDDDDPAENLPPYDSDSRSGPDTPMSDSIMETLAPVVERFKLVHKDSDPTLDSSPSLKDLEEIKKQLVMELSLASACSSPAIQDGNFSYPSDVEGEDSASVNYNSLPDVINLESSNDVSSFSEGSSISSPAQFPRQLQRTDSQGSRSKFVTLGTPSLSRHSSYQKLPEYDNFSKNVTSHMNFENLPNSTGTYQKMKKVIKKVKEKINSLIQ